MGGEFVDEVGKKLFVGQVKVDFNDLEAGLDAPHQENGPRLKQMKRNPARQAIDHQHIFQVGDALDDNAECRVQNKQVVVCQPQVLDGNQRLCLVALGDALKARH